ncbi:hypothetical protein KGQ19_01445 [Catenulispora sp. NL8]|uniref:Integral membrane protein n=1 Tax=Catenulispora pinistramenti TaxID=2705254 RepID=A0ABS5KI17_9ACTN|nr:hypothetical protein [Catenulispora pinistramenti]MBS2545525.1 hypothetical protein [Catenulispora pinistramenti]
MHRRSCHARRVLLLAGVAAALVVFAAGAAAAAPAVPGNPSSPPPQPVPPGIYGPLIGGGQMSPPPAVGPGLAPAGGSDPSWWDVPGQIEKAIDTWLGNLVKSALQPVLKLIGSTLLSSPDVSNGRIAQIWTGVLIMANTIYILFVLAAAVIVMGHETVQTRHSIKEIAPRLLIGIIASNASLWAISQSVSLGNALAAGLMNGQLSAEGIDTRLTSMVVDKIFQPSAVTQLFPVLIGGAIAAMGVALLVTCVLRAAILLVLTAGSPLALACHALPQTDPLAKLWWRAIIGCLATQACQALVLVTCCQVFFDPNADIILGLPSGGGLVDLLLALVLVFVLIKIPIWVTRIVLGRRPLGATLAGRLVKSYLLYRGFALARDHFARRPAPPRANGTSNNHHRPGPPTPGSALVPARGPYPGPGSGGIGGWQPAPETVTVTAAVVPDEPTAATTGAPRSARPHGPAPTTPLGPVRKPLALPPGRSTRLDRLQEQHLSAPPPPRGRQYGLFGPVEKEPGAAPARPVPTRPEPRPGAALRHEPAFPNPSPRKRAPNPPAVLPLAPVFLPPVPDKPRRRRGTTAPEERG